MAAAEAGADAIGLVFYESSPRNITTKIAAHISTSLGPFVTRVALVVDPEREQVEKLLDSVPIDVIQFHGAESEPFCASFNCPYVKAIRVAPETDVEKEMKRYASASGILLDTYHPKLVGGTGKTFSWDKVPSIRNTPLILAGGLNSGNVAQAIRDTQPYAVDVSGAVESTLGIKDPAKIVEFIQSVNSTCL